MMVALLQGNASVHFIGILAPADNIGRVGGSSAR